MPRKKPSHNAQVTSQLQKEAVMAAITKYDRRGYTQMEIKNLLKIDFGYNLSVHRIGNYQQMIREDYAKAKIMEREALVNEKIEQLREVRREAWEAWERSKQPLYKKVKEKSPPLMAPEGEDRKSNKKLSPKELLKFRSNLGKARHPDRGGVIESLKLMKLITTQEGRLPANVFLETILKTLEVEAKLRGLFIDIHVNNNTTNNLITGPTQFPWEEFFDKVCQVDSVESVDAPITVEATPVALPESV